MAIEYLIQGIERGNKHYWRLVKRKICSKKNKSKNQSNSSVAHATRTATLSGILEEYNGT